jgi:hypothetical protein
MGVEHIILDIDQTLIGWLPEISHVDNVEIEFNKNLHRVDGWVVQYRPYLGDFLNFLFKQFKSVSIWTASSQQWADDVVNKILYPLMNSQYKFRSVLSRDHLPRRTGYPLRYYKPLKLFWDTYKDMNAENTLIIDDREKNFSQNESNGILIPKYSFGNQKDNHLKNIQPLLIQWKSMPVSHIINQKTWFKQRILRQSRITEHQSPSTENNISLWSVFHHIFTQDH